MVEWLRKNSFIRELRAYLKRFRIVDVQREIYHELKPVENAAGGQSYEPTGRFVIQIRLTGFWRQK